MKLEIEAMKKAISDEEHRLSILVAAEAVHPHIPPPNSDSLLTPASVLRSDIEGKKREVERRESVLRKRLSEIEKKEESRRIYKQKHKDDEVERRKDSIARKAAEGSGYVYEGEAFEPLISLEDASATIIQKIARRRMATRKVEDRRKLFNYAALEIQSAYRGWLGRRRHRIKREERDAATDVQRLFRGLYCLCIRITTYIYRPMELT
jgi:hypothetical protein